MTLLVNFWWVITDQCVNTMRCERNGWQFADDNAFACIKIIVFWYRICWSLILEVQIDNESALVQVMAWHQIGAKPLPKPMMTQFIDRKMNHQALIGLMWAVNQSIITQFFQVGCWVGFLIPISSDHWSSVYSYTQWSSDWVLLTKLDETKARN